MISKYIVKIYCCEDISLIENYNEAINDNEQNWDCHHRLEIELNKTAKELIDLNLYYNRPASELIFLTKSEHGRIHHKGKHHSEETKQKIRESCKGKNLGNHLSEEHKQKISEFRKGKHHSEETKQKMREAQKDKPKSEATKLKIRETWAKRKALFNNSTESN